MGQLFGTDGVRAVPGRYPLVEGVVARIAEAAARLLLDKSSAGQDPLVVMGRDTRGSGPALSRWLSRGFAAAGCRTLDLGVAPTPAVAYIVPRLGALAGVVVSASHNPAEFNGIKFFTADGYKMPAELEEAVEKALASLGRDGRRPAKSDGPEDGSGLLKRYEDFLRSTFPACLDLCGLRLVVDCAHGAAARIAPALFENLGAQVTALGCAPSGDNINAGCGALAPQRMQAAVRRCHADCGVSFDGDADRAIFADEKGDLLDGDALLCLAALHLNRNGLLRSRRIVLTVMSNYGLIKFLESKGISVETVPVGDRNVTEAIETGNLSLGGESSGHIIFRSFSSTGDGILTALQILAALREMGGTLSSHRAMFRPMPQVLENLSVERKVPLDRLPRLQSLARRCEKELRGDGRVFLRYSGTEPLLRIMVEGPRRSRIERMARRLAVAYWEETGACPRRRNCEN